MSNIGRTTFCIAPCCSNEYYRLKESGRIVHFHAIPLKKPEVLRRWLAALKRLSPPMGPARRVCSDHFIEADYIEEGAFAEDGRFVRRPTSRLKPDAVPTIFKSDPGAALRRERAQKCACQAEERESLQIELRKRGVVTKDTNPAARPATQTGERTRDGANLRREKRGAVRGGRGGRGGKYSTNERQTMGPKSKLYDAKGVLISSGKDMCDCLDVDCMGCFYPCPDCGARKCGVECRCHRKWLYEQVEVEGGEIIRNKFAV
ncbi:ARL14 effector protein isoform X1 [Gadus chalcogrammus]|uniref:ARL14 effector protein isoform X1 n=1 Tax=Gadus chalcogrammus TaxID=1042646 RepID=UPI0024C4A619|nr:ARL14 effector protein isoform X1 [Gadus chalcogrammus]